MIDRIAKNISVVIQTLRVAEIGYNGIGTDEAVKIRVIKPNVIVPKSFITAKIALENTPLRFGYRWRLAGMHQGHWRVFSCGT